MSTQKKLALLAMILMIAPLVLTGCGPQPEAEIIYETVIVEKESETVVETVEVEKEVVVTETVEVEKEVEATPEMVDRLGGWFDTVIFVGEPSTDMAITRLEVGDIDVYAPMVSEPDVAKRIFESEVLAYETAYGGYDEITFTASSSPEFNDGRLNPFYSDKIREAMNWLIDRDYIAQEISGGLAVPRYVPVNYASKDSALLADTIAAISLEYAHDPDRAVEVISAEMEALGAEMVDGSWTYKGEPVEIIALIRNDDERQDLGDYVSLLLEDIGFTVQRDYKSGSEAGPCWLRADPDEGCAHLYTGAWNSQVVSRDSGSNFSFFYTPDGLPFPPWQAYTPDPEFYEIATRLTNNDFTTMQERAELMAAALDYALQDSQRVWLKDDVSISPHAADISLASDLSGSIVGSWLWATTIRRAGQVGGSVTIVAGAGELPTPWNPIAGVGGILYGMPVLGTIDHASGPDPYTGLALPMRLESAEVYVQEGLPVDVTMDWVNLEFVPEIVVPDDAWVDWDAESQVFITAGERFTETQTALSKTVMHYEQDMFDKMKWHDGSPVTIGDFVLRMILAFDRAKEASPYFDESHIPISATFMDAFKGWKIASEDPLVIEYYTDAYALDAENNAQNFQAAYPQGAWHNIAPGLRAEANGELAFSDYKAGELEVEWTSFIAGPSLEILKAKLDECQVEGFIPYAPTLGEYVTAQEAATRYDNLQEWYRRHGHFWIGSGPYFLQGAFPVEGTMIMQHNPYYPDPATRWDQFTEPPLPELVVDGPGSVAIGEEAVFDIFVTFKDMPYPVDEIDMVKYLVYGATGELEHVGYGEPVEDGYWQAVLGAELTGDLQAGSNKLAVIVVSKRAVVPVTETVLFVTQ